MNLAWVRRGLHATHALTSLILLATGVLLWEPDLRARLVGGFGREILQAHMWAGWVFIAAPGLAGLLAARLLLGDLTRRLGPPDGLTWKKFHIVTSLVLGGVLSATGVLLWIDLDLSVAWLDRLADLHLAATWVLAATLPLHLFSARRKILARIRDPRGASFVLDPDDC